MPTLLLPKGSVPPCAHRLHLSQLLTRCEGRWLYSPLLCLLSACRYGVPWRCPQTFLNLHPRSSTYNPIIHLIPDFTSEHRTSSLLCLHLRDRWPKHIQENSAPPSATSTPPRPPPAWGTAPPISCPANLGMSLTPLSQDLPHPTSQEFLVFSLLDGSSVHCSLTVWPLAMLSLPEHGGYGLFVPSDLVLGPISNGYCSRLLKCGLCSGHLCAVPSRDSVALTVLTNSLLRRGKSVSQSPVAFLLLSPTHLALSSWSPARQCGLHNPHSFPVWDHMYWFLVEMPPPPSPCSLANPSA